MTRILLITFAISVCGCATLLKGYKSNVEINSDYPDSLRVFTKDGIEIPFHYKTQTELVHKTVHYFPGDQSHDVWHTTLKIDSTTEIIRLRSSHDHFLLLRGKSGKEKYMAYSKIGIGWFVLDIALGGVPAIVDAITGNWNYFDNIHYEGK